MIVDDFPHFFGDARGNQRIGVVVFVGVPGIKVQRDLVLAAIVEEPFPINLFDDVVNIPYNEVQAIDSFAESLFFSGTWSVCSSVNIWGIDPGDAGHLQGLVDMLVPFPALSGMGQPEYDWDAGIGQQLTGFLAAEAPVSSFCDAETCLPITPTSPVTGFTGLDSGIWWTEILSGQEKFPLINDWFQVPLSDLLNGYTFNSANDPGVVDPSGPANSLYNLLGTNTVDGQNLMPWDNSTFTLNPSQPFDNFFNSLMATPTGGLLYNNATANTIKWYYTGLIIYLPDGTVIPVPDTTAANPSISVSGLTPSTTYNFYPYYNVDRKQVLWALVPGGTGTPAAAYAAKSILGAQEANGDGNIGLSPASSVTAAATSGGGGGGGGGGSGCVRSTMVVQTRKSLLRLGNLQIGDEILGPTGWTFVERKKTTVQPHFIRFDFGRGDFLDVTTTEPMPNFQNGLRLPAKLWSMENMLKSRSGMPAVIQSISLVSESDQAVSLLLNPYHEFFVGGKRASLVLSNSVPVK